MKAVLSARSARGNPAAQMDALRAYAAAHGQQVVGELREQISGLAQPLPKFEDAVQRARAVNAGIVC